MTAIFDDADPSRGGIERETTGVRGLDVVLKGGLFRGGVYILVGPPGAGKTVLGNQVCSHHVANGGKAVYVTLLTESHGRMVAHLQSFTFFDPVQVSTRLVYISGYSALESEGLKGLLDLLRRVVRDHGATLLVVDGVPAVEEVAPTSIAFKRFLRELNAFVNLAGCTTLLIAPLEAGRPQPEHALADGVITLGVRATGMRASRRLAVHKFRGSDYLQGYHSFEITRDGVVVHPRTEALLSAPPAAPKASVQRTPLGVRGLDEMLRGGVRRATVTTVLGAPGTGKTMLGLQFLEYGAARGEQSLYFGFYEPPERLVDKAASIGLDLQRQLDAGTLEVLWQPALENILDALAEKLLEAVRRRGVRRLFIDGLNAFEQASLSKARLGRFFTALTNELRALGVTTILSVETHVFHNRIEMPISGLAPTVENIVFLRYTELHSQSYRLLSVLKVRDFPYDPSIREFEIGEHGVMVSRTFASAEDILRGTRRPEAGETEGAPVPEATAGGRGGKGAR